MANTNHDHRTSSPHHRQRPQTPVGERIVYGYVRVSSTDQNEDRQLIALRQEGIEEANIFIDHKSGKDFNRPAWRKLMRRIHNGDQLIITSLDRLGRNYEEMQEIWRKLTKKNKIAVRVLDMPILNASPEAGLTSAFLGDLVLQVLSYVAQIEREHIHTRQKEGIAAAHLRGVKFGRPKIPLPEDFSTLKQKVLAHELPLRDAAKLCGLSVSTFRRRMVQ